MLRLLSIQGESDRTETTNTWCKDTKKIQYNDGEDGWQVQFGHFDNKGDGMRI